MRQRRYKLYTTITLITKIATHAVTLKAIPICVFVAVESCRFACERLSPIIPKPKETRPVSSADIIGIIRIRPIKACPIGSSVRAGTELSKEPVISAPNSASTEKIKPAFEV